MIWTEELLILQSTKSVYAYTVHKLNDTKTRGKN
jgi:hypothetical protein